MMLTTLLYGHQAAKKLNLEIGNGKIMVITLPEVKQGSITFIGHEGGMARHMPTKRKTEIGNEIEFRWSLGGTLFFILNMMMIETKHLRQRALKRKEEKNTHMDILDRLPLECKARVIIQGTGRAKHLPITIQLFGCRIGFLSVIICLNSFLCSGQSDLQAFGGIGVVQSVYKMSANNSDLVPPKEVGLIWGLGLQYVRGRLSTSIQYENRNFQEAGPRYGEHFAGLNQFSVSLRNYIHSASAQIGLGLIKSEKRLKIVPDIGFSLGYINAYPINNREPTVNDSDNYSRFSIESIEDSTLSQTGHMHAVYTSRFIPSLVFGLSLSYALSNRISLLAKIVYTYGMVDFYKAKFIISDFSLSEPIFGRLAYSGTAIGVRFGLAYRLNQVKDI